MNLRSRPAFGLASEADSVDGNPGLGQSLAGFISQCVSPGDDIRLGF